MPANYWPALHTATNLDQLPRPIGVHRAIGQSNGNSNPYSKDNPVPAPLADIKQQGHFGRPPRGSAHRP